MDEFQQTLSGVEKSTSDSRFAFAADYNDHFETPAVAYEDLKPFLELCCSIIGKSKETVVLYDPYWCQGNMIQRLQSCGYCNVINRNRDFYGDVKRKCVPAHDILVTNPPYSGEHKSNLLTYLSAPQMLVPYALLLPVYTATKSYWRQFARAQTAAGRNPMYILPPSSYEVNDNWTIGVRIAMTIMFSQTSV